MNEKPHVRWRFVSEHGEWSCWEIFRTDGVRIWPRIIVFDPKSKKGQRGKPLDERVISILELKPRGRRRA